MMRILDWLKRVKGGPGQRHRERWQDRIFIGHVSIGRVTIYGANAMHWAVNVWIAGNYWCFHPTTRTFGGRWPWYFYISPNATPWAAVLKAGPGVSGEGGK